MPDPIPEGAPKPPAEDMPVIEQPKVEVPLTDPVKTDEPEEPKDA